MANSFIFADEAGCFVFKPPRADRKGGPSTYFILTTVAAPDWGIAGDLLKIRRSLALSGEPDRDKLHATTDLQEVRNEVFSVLAKQPFRIDCTILKKNKAQPQTRTSDTTFYQYAWFYHFKHVGPILSRQCDKMLITAAALGQKRSRAAFKAGVNNPLQQCIKRDKWEVAFHESCKDPLLWVADYCSWAIQRKWEHGDDRSYSLIQSKIKTEYDLFASGLKEYY